MTDLERQNMYDYKDTFYVVNKVTNEKYEREFVLEDFADGLIAELSNTNVYSLSQEEYDKWLTVIYNNFEVSVMAYYKDDFEFPDLENKLLLDKLRAIK